MISRYIFSAFLALGLLISTISGAPVIENSLLGRSEYSLRYSNSRGFWDFGVFSEGYKNKQEAVDTFNINTATKTLTVESMWNGYDMTPNRLRLKDILKACWEKTGLKTSDLNFVRGERVQNPSMEKAIVTCHKAMNMGKWADIEISHTSSGSGKKCWEAFEKTDFSQVIYGFIRTFDIPKKLIGIKVNPEFGGTHVMYTFG
ncbi:hypothetical protein FDECE_15194 [Fusarium decemcellulare]|nr:hypothetical protein FDECE_15194 [Fusarium decemcellulare]